MIFIGDVHGCYRTLLALLDRLPPGEDLCFLGDLIDRGPESAQVVELVMERGWKCVMGNHEKMMLDACARPYDLQYPELWMRNGGVATMESYPDMVMRERHLTWMAKLPAYLAFPDLVRDDGRCAFVSHAGVYPGLAGESFETVLDRCINSKDIVWHRDPIGDFPGIFQIIGHTPTPDGARVEKHFANIDTGAFFRRPHFGRLTALQFPSMQIFTQFNIDYPDERMREVSP